jgi:hypothetical protein
LSSECYGAVGKRRWRSARHSLQRFFPHNRSSTKSAAGCPSANPPQPSPSLPPHPAREDKKARLEALALAEQHARPPAALAERERSGKHKKVKKEKQKKEKHSKKKKDKERKVRLCV